MTLTKRLAGIPLVRPFVLRVLNRLGDRDITVKHGWTGDRLFVHMFRHRGYWFHGRSREAAEMRLAAQLARDCELVVDVGAHVGYLSLYYRKIAPQAIVVAIEPSPTNLVYLYRNADEAEIRVRPCAVGDRPGSTVLYEDALSGQNSSLIRGFAVMENNARFAAFTTATREVQVDVETLDRITDEYSERAGFVKIDVEGFECEALQGATGLLARDRPSLQVEVQRKGGQIVDLLEDAGYALFSARTRDQVVHASSPRVVFGVPDGPDARAFEEVAAAESYRRI